MLPFSNSRVSVSSPSAALSFALRMQASVLPITLSKWLSPQTLLRLSLRISPIVWFHWVKLLISGLFFSRKRRITRTMITTTTMARTIESSITMPKPVMTSLNKKSNMSFETYLPHPRQCPRDELHTRVEELPELVRHIVSRGVYRRRLAHAAYLLEGADVGIVANRIDGDV